MPIFSPAPGIPGFADFPAEDTLSPWLANADAVDSFWAEVKRVGTPLADPDSHRVTFLSRDAAHDERTAAAPVHLHVNRVTDKDGYDLGFMRAIPGTGVHVRTLELTPTLRAAYGFTFPAPGQTHPQGPPPHDRYPTFLDPLNRLPPLARDDEAGHGLSIFAGRFSAPQPEWEGPDPAGSVPLRGVTLATELALSVGADDCPVRRVRLYLPPRPVDGSAVPLLTVFDAETWFGRLGLPGALERAADARRLPPVAVLGVENLSTADRKRALGANDAFLSALAGDATAWAEAQATAHDVDLAGRDRRIIAGQSLGALSALWAAHTRPDSYGIVIAQSPSMWWRPGGAGSPRDLGMRPSDWITEEFSGRLVGDARILLTAGVREGLTLNRVHLLRQTLRSRGWAASIDVYDGGHDIAWWRGALLDRLEEALT